VVSDVRWSRLAGLVTREAGECRWWRIVEMKPMGGVTIVTVFLFLFWTPDPAWIPIRGSLLLLLFTLDGRCQLRNARGNPPGLGVGGQPAVIRAGRCGEGGAGSELPNLERASLQP